jgi:cation diffusion facilitator family transporter
MNHDHEYSYKIGEKGAWLGILSNIALFVLKFLAGVFGRSQAMIADAFHTASDAFTSIVVLVGFKIARKPADREHPYGHGRAESITAKIVALVLIFVGLKLVHDSAKILILKEMVKPHSIALFAALISIVIKEFTYRRVLLISKKINSISLKADAYHHRSDVLSSIAALVGITGARMGWTFLDPLAGILVAGFIIKVGADTFHVAYDELMDAAPPKGMVRQIEKIVMATEGVLETKKVMVRKYGIELFLEVTIGVDRNKTVQEGHFITTKVEKNLRDKMTSVEGVLVHVEPAKRKT